MSYVYVGSGARSFAGCRSCGGFGQSGSFSEAVRKLQRGLRAIAASTGNEDYHPGPADGLYGRNTHAALLRVSRDFLEPRGLVSSGCRSTCNTLWLRAKGACRECLGGILRDYNKVFSAPAEVPVSMGAVDVLPTPPVRQMPEHALERLTDAEIAEIAERYGGFLDAYVAKYGDGGQLDPAQIARREDVSMEEAERRAAERRREAAGPAVRKAGFSWWWLVLLLGLGGAVWYAWGARREDQE